jgi:hypothetical protein
MAQHPAGIIPHDSSCCIWRIHMNTVTVRQRWSLISLPYSMPTRPKAVKPKCLKQQIKLNHNASRPARSSPGQTSYVGRNKRKRFRQTLNRQKRLWAYSGLRFWLYSKAGMHFMPLAPCVKIDVGLRARQLQLILVEKCAATHSH